jgi:hypothetical protein
LASTITVNNITTAVPGVFSKLDASGLAQVGLSASGVVAILGTATGGLPYTAAAGNPGALPRITSPQALKNLIGSGDVLEAGMMAFDPSSDPNVRGGAQIVVPVQVNPETQASLVLSDATDPVLTLSARVYGAGGNALQATVSAGSSSGVKLVLKQTATGQTETFDNLSTLAALVSKVSGSSRLASATPSSGATALPIAGSAQPFTGGSTSSATSSDWQKALDLLKQARVTEVVVLSADSGVISAAQNHVDYMCGAGASERQAFVGYCQADGTPHSLSDIVAFIQTIGDRNVQVLVESVQRFGTDGTLQTFPAYFLAAIAAGMRGGAGLGEPLTHKYIKAQGIIRDISWNPVDNADALIAAGALITQRVDGIGTRFVRDITSYLQDSNLAFVEGSVNASLNYVAYTLRTTVEFAVGRPGFAGTKSAVQTATIAALALMVQNAILASYTKPEVTPVNDQFQVSVQVAPNLPVNFIAITLNVSTPQSLAAA